MYRDSDRPKRFYAPSYYDDLPQTKPGSAIPHGYGQTQSSAGPTVLPSFHAVSRYPEASFATALLLLVFSFFVFQAIDRSDAQSMVATPILALDTDHERFAEPIRYGSDPRLGERGYFEQLQAVLQADGEDFLTVDLERMQVRYYEQGTIALAFPIQAKGRPGSWWETPAGLYQIRAKETYHTSIFDQVRLPWSLPFQGNAFIHGWPERLDGTPVAESESLGGIRLETADAERLFGSVEPGTMVLVFEPRVANGTFRFDPTPPQLTAPQYLIADVESGTILHSRGLNDQVSVASLTKLMTALIAVENINLNTRVRITEQSLINSLIPRLVERREVSIYSLLQLLLMESSNEAAEAIGQLINRDRFISLMNQKARSLGMNDTTFADPSGLSADNRSSLPDLLRLTEYLYFNRSFILQLTHDQYLPTHYDAHGFGQLTNFNLVADLDDFYGGKIGETRAAGQTSLTLHNFTIQDQERVIAIIVLGSSDRSGDVTKLHQYFTERWAR